MKALFQNTAAMLSLIIAVSVIAGVTSNASADRSFYVADEVTGKIHSVTERSLKACESMPYNSVINIDGVNRRCIKPAK